MAETRPRPLERVGWVALLAIALTSLVLAILRPVDAQHVSRQIRLAEGFDRYERAMSEGGRFYSRATADGRMRSSIGNDRAIGYTLLARAEERFLHARAEAIEFGEARRAERALWRAYMVWAEALQADAIEAAGGVESREMLDRAQSVVTRAAALATLSPDERARVGRLRSEIEQALRVAEMP